MVKTFRVPPLLEVDLVYRALGTKRPKSWVVCMMQQNGCAIKSGPSKTSIIFIDATKLKETFVSVYQRCVEILMEEHVLAGNS